MRDWQVIALAAAVGAAVGISVAFSAAVQLSQQQPAPKPCGCHDAEVVEYVDKPARVDIDDQGVPHVHVIED